jgi:HEPN domain-containing protein
MADPKIKFEEWQRYAEDDRLAAEAILKEGGPANPICFHSQQMAEKYLKGFLLFFGKRFEKRHQLDYLLALCRKIDGSFIEIANEIKYLSDFYTETRYSGDIPEFTLEECRRAFNSALRTKEFVLNKIKIL